MLRQSFMLLETAFTEQNNTVERQLARTLWDVTDWSPDYLSVNRKVVFEFSFSSFGEK